MDIRRYFASNCKRKLSDAEDITPHVKKNTTDTEPKTLSLEPITSNTVLTHANVPQQLFNQEIVQVTNEFDIGNFVEEITIADEVKVKLLNSAWEPPITYKFKADVADGKRSFVFGWLTTYKSWLSYSSLKKGAFCRHCVVWKPKVKRGLQGAFILNPFIRYKHFTEQYKIHLASEWHAESLEKTTLFLNVINNKSVSVINQLNEKRQMEIDSNRNILKSIISTIVFCGTHDMPLRGRLNDEGNFIDLLHFRIESGDCVLGEHISKSNKNARYISATIQNKLIAICGNIVRSHLIADLTAATYFSIIADESADISGIEQLSLGVRFVCCKTGKIREEFLGYIPLHKTDAESIATSIIENFTGFGINLSNMVGQGYDGCSVMAGKENGVQKRIIEAYPQAQYFHCASHRLNLVVNDLNNVVDVRNAVGTIKKIIVFFRESPQRRILVPNIQLLCETRWSEKYKSIRKFKKNFITIVSALYDLSNNANNSTTSQTASQLASAATTSTFLVALHIISIYSNLLEPVVNILQGTQINISDVQTHMSNLIKMFKAHRTDATNKFKEIFEIIKNIASELQIEISVHRRCSHQKHRANYNTINSEDFYRQSIYIPYLDSIINSLESRFPSNLNTGHKLYKLHPRIIKNMSKVDLDVFAKEISDFYSISGFCEQLETWQFFWLNNKNVNIDNINYNELCSEYVLFYPAIKQALQIFLSLPSTTCSVERSFSTLRRVKTWLRSTMSEDRLNGLCMLSVHKHLVKSLENFVDEVINKFAEEPRRLQFLFSDNN